MGDLTKETSSQNAEGATWFLFAAYSKMQEKRELLKELFKQKVPRLAGFEYFQPLQMANDTMMKKWLLSKDQIRAARNAWPKDEANSIVTDSLVKTSYSQIRILP